MTRTRYTFLLVLMLTALVAVPVFAADPTVSKRVIMEDDGSTVVVLNVVARDRAVYGLTVVDASASIDDIVAPDGWAAVTTGDRVSFRTVDKPIRSGSTLAFRIVTTGSSSELGVTFRDDKSSFGSKKKI